MNLDDFKPTKIPVLKQLTLDLRSAFNDGYLEVKPQKGPQTQFISCMGGISGTEKREHDFPLIFYGGAK